MPKSRSKKISERKDGRITNFTFLPFRNLNFQDNSYSEATGKIILGFELIWKKARLNGWFRE